jgi:hypothetical protein
MAPHEPAPDAQDEGVQNVFRLEDVYGTPLPPPFVIAPGPDTDVLQRIADRVRGRVPCIPVSAPGASPVGPALCVCAPSMTVASLCIALGRVFVCLGAMRTLGVVHLGICPWVMHLPSCSWTAAAVAASAAAPHILLTRFVAGGWDAGVAGARTHLVSAHVQATLDTATAAARRRSDRFCCNVYIPPEVTVLAELKAEGVADDADADAPVIARFRSWLSTCTAKGGPLEALFAECEAAMIEHTRATRARWRQALASAGPRVDHVLAGIEVEIVRSWDVYSLAVATLFALLVRHDAHDPVLTRAVTLLLTRVCGAPLHERATLSCHALGMELAALGGWLAPARAAEPTEVPHME